MNIKERLCLIKRNTEEIIGEDELEELLKSKKEISIYWGTAPTGKPHVGYMLPMLKVADLLKAGFKVKILLADLHAALDNTPWDLLEYRYKYYSKVIDLLLQAMGADTKKLQFVKGSSYQFSKEYIYDLFKLSSMTTAHDAHKAASEVVKMGDSPKLSGYIYPLMQALDEEYLKVDAQLGGTDQRKIMVFAREKLPQIGYKKRIEIINPLIPGLVGIKMSASNENSKIDLTDDADTIKKKINSADCKEGDLNNGIIAITKYILFTIKQDNNKKLVIKRPEKYGGNLEYNDYEHFEKDFKAKKLHPLDLKNCVAEEIINLLQIFQKHKTDLVKLAKLGYG